MLRAADVLADLVTAARDGGSADAERNGGLIDELKGLVALAKGEEPPLPRPRLAAARVPPRPSPTYDDGMGDLDFTPVAVDLSDLMGMARRQSFQDRLQALAAHLCQGQRGQPAASRVYAPRRGQGRLQHFGTCRC